MIRLLDNVYSETSLQLITPDKRNLKNSSIIKKGLFGDSKKERQQKEIIANQLTIRGSLRVVEVINDITGIKTFLFLFTSQYNEQLLINVYDLVHKNKNSFYYSSDDNFTNINGFNVNVNWLGQDLYCDVYIKRKGKSLYKDIDKLILNGSKSKQDKRNKQIEFGLDLLDGIGDIFEFITDIVD